jgi:lipoate-protein ligase A
MTARNTPFIDFVPRFYPPRPPLKPKISLMTAWRYIPSRFFPDVGQMAYDENLFSQFKSSDSPILRFFIFQKPTLTLGRLEARRLHIPNLPFPYEIRPTGGRGVLHGSGDLCYALLASKQDPIVGGGLIESYCRVGKILARGLQSLGRDVRMTEEKHLGMGDPHCFSAPSQAELTLRGKKVAGGAQARREGVFLQQGVILLKVAEEWKKAFPGSGFEAMTGLNEDPAKPSVAPNDLENALLRSFEKEGIRFDESKES